MRVGTCSIQQSLTPEATNLVKQAINLAKRRGHAQVTPLHVASAMLASSTSLLRNACLKSHSHPLQLKALELCFNVALNRLPTSASSPLLGHSSVLFPSFSNALVAAFKRAQAHQRRGSVENQQQPILALKIEIEQLVISILDDPSVSRVMKEAGFSSTHVKINLEQIVSIELCSATPLQSKEPSGIKPLALGTIVSHPHPSCHQFEATSSDVARNDDVMNVFDTMMNKRRKCTVIVGECISSAEAVARCVISKFERGNIRGILRYVQLIRLPLSSLMNLGSEEVEQKMMDLRCNVKSCLARGVVLYLGDLKWIAEFWSNSFGDNKKRSSYYFALEHIIMELRRLITGVGENGRLWLMGIASFQTYMDCKTGHPSLKSLLDICPLKIPVCSLELSLKIESSSQGKRHYRDGFAYSENLDNEEAQSIPKMILHIQDSTTITKVATYSKLPSWLQQYKDEANNMDDSKNQSYDNMKGLSKKWNIFGTAASPKQSNIISSSSSPSSSSSISSFDQSHRSKTQKHWPIITYEQPLLKIPDLLSNPNSSPNSATSSEAIEDIEDNMENLSRFKEFNAENLEFLTAALEKKVPWMKEIIPEISTTVLKCRSKAMTRKFEASKPKEETWMFFSGFDSKSKQRVAKELGKLVFGSSDCYASIKLSTFASTRADSTDVSSNKRRREDDHSGSNYIERFGEALRENPQRVFFMEEIEQADYESQVGFKRAIENGNVKLSDGELVSVEDAIVIFSCESFSCASRAPSPPCLVKRQVLDTTEEAGEEEEDEVLERKQNHSSMSLDLNICIGEENDSRTNVIGMILDTVDKHIIFNIHEL